MKKTMTTIALLFGMSIADGPLRIGIMPFVNNSLSEKEAFEPLSRGLADMMATELSRISALSIVERAQLERLLRETKLSMAGITEERAAEQTGKMANADLLLLGSFTKGFDRDIRIDIRIVSVETGTASAAADISGRPEKIFRLVKKLAFKTAEGLKLKLSREEKKALDTPLELENFAAFMAYSEGLTAEAKEDIPAARAFYKKALSIAPDYKDALRALELLEKHHPAP